jgi:hypothetical protein
MDLMPCAREIATKLVDWRMNELSVAADASSAGRASLGWTAGGGCPYINNPDGPRGCPYVVLACG